MANRLQILDGASGSIRYLMHHTFHPLTQSPAAVLPIGKEFRSFQVCEIRKGVVDRPDIFYTIERIVAAHPFTVEQVVIIAFWSFS